MKINPKQKYKIVDKDLINGSYVVTGKELNKILDESVKEVIKSKEVAWTNIYMLFIEMMTHIHVMRMISPTGISLTKVTE